MIVVLEKYRRKESFEMEEQKNWKYKFTVVTPVYNVEKYLEETIESVIAQTIGFEENIQMILVNDGSPDNSGEICQRYQEKYPNNILYLEKENGGVSSARNEAIPYIEGKYVNFLDSDDKWEEDALAIVYDFFEKNYKKIDVVAARKRLFEAREGYHNFDYKFEKTRVVYLLTQYDHVHLDVTAAFIKAEAIGEHRFCTKLKYGEDAAFINEIILEKCTIGMVREAEHLYRKRYDNSSALQNELKSESYYVDSPKYFHQALFDKSIERYGKIQDFIQYTVMHDIGWRIQRDVGPYLNDSEMKSYKKVIRNILEKIDDRIILRQRTFYKEYKVYAMSLKYGRDIRKELVYDMGKLLFQNIELLNFLDITSMVTIIILEIEGKNLHLEGKINTWIPDEDYEIVAEGNGKRYPITFFDVRQFDKKGLDGICYRGKGFRLDIPLKKNGKKQEKEWEISFSIWYREIYRKKINFSFGKFAHLNEEETSYYYKKPYLVRREEKKLICKTVSRNEVSEYEKMYQKTLEQLGLQELNIYRKWYFMMNKLKRKEIWLVSDRFNQVDDNGEHLFLYLVKHNPKGVKVYFVLEKGCPDYMRLKKYGKVVEYDSFRYKMLFLLSDKIISSQASDTHLNAFEEMRIYMSNLYNFKFVFLQHGIIKDDLSGWFHKLNKNLKIFVCSGKTERKSLLDDDYYYDDRVIQMTGLPRFDNLMRLSKEGKKQQKKIFVIPTWRYAMKDCYDKFGQHSIYSENFKESEYFKFYNGLMQDERLLSCMRKKGYQGVFGLHPLLVEQWVDFQENDVFKINHGKVNYQKEFTESSLLVTDYSSVFFDFSWLKKPVVYTQFDKEEFFASHSYEQGDFDYERDGFGPVCTNYEEAVRAIINLVENDCQMEEKYAKRVEEFYPFFDENNCKRVTEAIRQI